MGINLGGNQPQAQGLQLGGGSQAPTVAPVILGGGLNLSKGSRLDLTKSNPGLDRILVGLGWDLGGTGFDLDVEAFGLNSNGKVVSPAYITFYNQPLSPCGAIKHNGDNRTGVGDGDDETLSIQLSKVSPDVQKIVFVVTINEAMAKNQNFGQVNNAYIRIVDEATVQQVCRFDLTEDYSTSISLIVGEVYRNGSDWKFNAVGTGSTADLGGLCSQYGAM